MPDPPRSLELAEQVAAWAAGGVRQEYVFVTV